MSKPYDGWHRPANSAEDWDMRQQEANRMMSLIAVEPECWKNGCPGPLVFQRMDLTHCYWTCETHEGLD